MIYDRLPQFNEVMVMEKVGLAQGRFFLQFDVSGQLATVFKSKMLRIFSRANLTTISSVERKTFRVMKNACKREKKVKT